MQIKERQIGDVCLIALAMTPQTRGKYDALQTLVREQIAAGIHKFVFELSACEWIDSTALGEFIKVQVHVMRQGGQMRLAAVPPKVRALFEVTNLAQVFAICDSEAEALAQLTEQHVYQVALEAELSAKEQEFIRQALREFNRQKVGYRDHQELFVVVRDEAGKLCGGLLGWTMWNRLMIDWLWLAEPLRGKGYGSQLIAAAEAEAVRRGCNHAVVETLSFQALDFYRKQNYTVVCELKDFPTGHSEYWLHKKLG